MKEVSPKQQVENIGWFSGLISGAGKILTSVFLNDDDYSSSYSDSCSDFELDTDLNECGDASHKDNNVTNQPSTELEKVKTERRSVDSPSNAKLSIEKLLQEENYSRNESKRLEEIIQSRVVRPLMTENGREEIDADFPNRNNNEDTASSRNPCSPGYVNTFHIKSSANQTCIPHTTSMAIMEVKKRVDRKRLSSRSMSSLSYGPCVLNTDNLDSESIRDGGSSVDESESYMETLLKWKSPITTSFGIPSTVGRKRIHIKEDSKDFLEATRSVRQKIEEMSSSRFCKTYVRSKKGIEPGSFLNSFEANNRMGQDGNAIETVFDDHSHAIHCTSDANTNRTNLPVSNNSITTNGDDIHTFNNNTASMLKETKTEQKIKHERSAKGNCSAEVIDLQSKTKIKNDPFVLNHNINVKDQAGAIVVHKGCAGDSLLSKLKGSLAESASNTEEITGCTSLQRSSSSTENDQDEISMQINKQHCDVTMRSIKHMIKEQYPLNSENSQGRGRKTLSKSRRGK